MNTIWEALIGTPWWVYLLFFYLLKIGIIATKPREISLKKLFILPSIFLIISIHTLLTAVKPNTMVISIWICAFLLGASLGTWQILRLKLIFNKKNHTVKMPGTWLTLIIILVIFATKYYFGYQLAIDPELAQQTLFEISLVGLTGIISGLFIGRLMTLIYLYRK